MTSHKPGDIYFGEYVRFSTSDKKVGAALAGPDNAVGDIGTIEFVLDDSKRQVAWLKNPYGQLVGFLNNQRGRHGRKRLGAALRAQLHRLQRRA